MKEIEDVEARISDLEVEIKLLRNVMVKNGNTNATKKVLNEESVWQHKLKEIYASDIE